MIPKSSEIRFEVINQCNYDCAICMQKDISRPRAVMSLDLFERLLRKIMKESSQYKSVSFAGMGEPLLDPCIVDRVRYVSKQGLRPLLVTNGSLLTPAKFKELEMAGLYSVRVSFHGAAPKEYSKLHNVSTSNFFMIRKYLKEISEIKRITKLLITCVYVEGVNDSPIREWLKLWEGMEVDLVEIWKAHNWINVHKYRKVQSRKRDTCGRIINGPLQIQVDGTVNACCFDYDGKLVFGDLKTQSLKDIFDSAAYLDVKKAHESGRFEDTNYLCKNCDQRNTDKTGAIIYSSKYDIKDRVNLTSTAYDRL